MSAPSQPAADRIKDANSVYHDRAAASYDSKWGISFAGPGQRQVRAKMRKALGSFPARPFDAALEIGAGTGYFSLNLKQLGLVDEVTATDISSGMLETLSANAQRLGLEVETARAEAEELPFEGASFDLVFGHAVLHHIPDLERALGEFRRVLRPGGTIAFCGEPSRYGDLLAALPKRGAHAAAPLWRRLVGAPRRPEAGDGAGRHADHAGNGDLPEAESRDWHRLEFEVDVHAFAPGSLRHAVESAGFDGVRIRGEELLASIYGWTLRSLEATADPAGIPRAWHNFAYRSYLTLQDIDAALLEPRLPPQLFYNLVLSARR